MTKSVSSKSPEQQKTEETVTKVSLPLQSLSLKKGTPSRSTSLRKRQRIISSDCNNLNRLGVRANPAAGISSSSLQTTRVKNDDLRSSFGSGTGGNNEGESEQAHYKYKMDVDGVANLTNEEGRNTNVENAITSHTSRVTGTSKGSGAGEGKEVTGKKFQDVLEENDSDQNSCSVEGENDILPASDEGQMSHQSPSMKRKQTVQQHSPQRSVLQTAPDPQQPDGWRVKLYRLNADGSWDDCGTGRIVCLYRPPPSKPSSRTKEQALILSNDTILDTDEATSEHAEFNSNPRQGTPEKDFDAYKIDDEEDTAFHQSLSSPPKSPPASPDQWLYTETGEATLCVHAEVTKQHRQPRVLLRTRILLRDAYHRQGDNIITWCEPYFGNNNTNYSNNNSNTTNNNTNGVDLALSFQDNAGCMDIWRQITHVQARASELLKSAAAHAAASQQVQQTQQSKASVEDMAAQVAARHHASLQQQQQDMWYATNNNASKNNNGISNSNYHTNLYKSQIESDNEANSNTLYGSINIGLEAAVATTPSQAPSLPQPPTLQNLNQIADTIAALQHIQQRESLAMWIANDECAYLKALLELFPAAEERGDYGKLATLAACVKTILLLNDPSILELIVTVAPIFEQVCSCLEYDPDLREKANHRWFLRERIKFRTVVPMEDPELVQAIHRSFRVNYLRDTLLRPTMDESSLSTLSSLQSFTHADVVKGVTSSNLHHHHLHHQHHNSTGNGVADVKNINSSLYDSYVVRVIDLLCIDLQAIVSLEWNELEREFVDISAVDELSYYHDPSLQHCSRNPLGYIHDNDNDMSIVVESAESYGGSNSTTWKQYLAPQDTSLLSRRLRRQGAISFLKELVSMARMSLQQNDKDHFFFLICTLEIDVNDVPSTLVDRDTADTVSQTSQTVEVGSVASTAKSDRLDEKAELQQSHFQNSQQHAHNDGIGPGSVGTGPNSSYGENRNGFIESGKLQLLPPPTNLLSMLGSVLVDPNADATEKGYVLEIIVGVVMHDSNLIRRHCLEYHATNKKQLTGQMKSSTVDAVKAMSLRPVPNEQRQVVYYWPPNDLLAALIYLVDVEIDAGILLQVSEIMKIVLDTDMMSDHISTNAGFSDEVEGLPLGCSLQQQQQQHDQHLSHASGQNASSTEQKQFLSLFYEHYLEWLVAPFQFSIFHPVIRVPDHFLFDSEDSPLLRTMVSTFQHGISDDNLYFKSVPPCAVRTSFAIELLSFCVRAHLYRMKFFLLKSKAMSNVLKLLRPLHGEGTSGDRCLKLAALRFLRSILSVNDEFYHRHIIQHDLFAPVFEALRSNPVGDNLVSSAIVEMCDFIHSENIKSLIEYIVTKHLSSNCSKSLIPSLEDVSSPYVNTLTILRKDYEANMNSTKKQQSGQSGVASEDNYSLDATASSRYFAGGSVLYGPRCLSGKALDDQRKFREVDEEESYFDSDDTDTPTPIASSIRVPSAVDEVTVENQMDSDLHRAPPRFFSLAQNPLFNNLGAANSSDNDGNNVSDTR